MKVHFIPSMEHLPERGGVREHLLKLHAQLASHPEVELVDNPFQADLYHVESSWEPLANYPIKPMVYVCHGGFIPQPIPSVIRNLHRADVIVTVANWLTKEFFPHYSNKTVCIPNGVDLAQIDSYPVKNQLGLTDYVFYGKEWDYYIDDLVEFAKLNHDVKFVTTMMPRQKNLPENILYIGLQPHHKIINLLRHARCLLITGSEVCPTMLLEAWAVGCPVVAWDKHGSEELMRISPDHVIGGGLYDQPSKYAIEQVGIYGDDWGARGRQEVEAHYQWPMLVEEYVSVYKKLLWSDDGI